MNRHTKGKTLTGSVEAQSITVNGEAVASGTQQSAITNASTSHALNATFDDTEVETALNALGTKLNSALAALREYGIIAE